MIRLTLPLPLHMLPPTSPLAPSQIAAGFLHHLQSMQTAAKGGFNHNLFVVLHYQYLLLTIYFKRNKALNT